MVNDGFRDNLLGGWPTQPLWKIMDRIVSWDDEIPNWMESHNPFMFQSPPTSSWLTSICLRTVKPFKQQIPITFLLNGPINIVPVISTLYPVIYPYVCFWNLNCSWLNPQLILIDGASTRINQINSNKMVGFTIFAHKSRKKTSFPCEFAQPQALSILQVVVQMFLRYPSIPLCFVA